MSRFLVLGLGMLFSLGAVAGESGYIQAGQTHIVFKDGKKVGDWPQKQPRNLSSMSPGGSPQTTIFYDDDGTTRCYSIFDSGGSNSADAVALSCKAK